MRRTGRSPKILVLLTAVVMALTLAVPFGLPSLAKAAEVGELVPSAHGTIQIETLAPVKPLYVEGDVVTLGFRMISDDTAPRRDIVTSSTTLANASSCDWAAFPAGTGGRYSCALTGLPAITYTVTAEDAAAGIAEFELTFTEYPINAENVRIGEPTVSTITGSLPVEQSEVPVTIHPIGDSEDAFAVGEFGRARITSVQNPKDVYEVGDVLSFEVRYESLIDQNSDVVATSETVVDVAACNWANLPGQATGKYTCGYPAALEEFAGPITYTITEADAANGSAQITTTWTTTRLTDNAVRAFDLTVEVPAAAASTGPRPEGEYTVLASSGDWGFSCHRIPALTQAANGDILAAWDGRPGCGDAPNPNSILQSISSDGGQTWSDAVEIAAGSQVAPVHGYSDPAYVTDQETGDVFLFFVKSFDAGFFQSQLGTDPTARNVIHAAVMKSTDDGQTWTEPEVITADITNDPATWKARFASSGEGIQLRYGDAAGRLMLQYPLMLSNGTIQAYSVYSDDHGDTWQAGNPVGTFMDENKVVELSDGTLMLNTRDNANGGYRRVTLSTDQGINWGEVTQDLELPDPRNNASIIRAYPDAPMGSDEAKILLFSNAASQSGRVNGTVRISYDDGQTWAASRVFEPGSMSYSTLTPLDEPGKYGLFYEGENNQMRYMTISHDWVDPLRASVTPEVKDLNRGPNQLTLTIRNHGDAEITVTPSITAPEGVSVGALADVTLASGAEQEITADITVAESTGPGLVSLDFVLTSGEESATVSADYLIVLPPAEGPELDLTLVGELAAQAGYPTSNMFDGDPDTWFHSPWQGDLAVDENPYNIDLTVGDEPVALERFVFTPKPGGTSGGDNNGRPGAWTLLVGDSLDDLTEVDSGVWADDSEPKIVELDGVEARFIRLVLNSTNGDGVMANNFVAAAELQAFGIAQQADLITVTLTRTDALGSPVEVGDELTFDVTYTNNTASTLTAFPRTSNLDDMLPPDPPNCRWAGLLAGATQTCTFPLHVVTEADLETGSFTPEVVFDATADRDGTQVLQAGIVATLPAIQVGTVVDPSATATVTVTPTATATATATVTATTTATATSSATVTATASTTATVTSTATATATATTTTTVTAGPTVTNTVTADPTEPSQTATTTPTTDPTAPPVDIYTTPGYHDVNGREWFTACEPYSQTQRCRTDIWASQVKVVDGTPQWVHGWAFNNLTYLPIDRSVWGDNPLANNGAWTAEDGRNWNTECDNATTGRNGCRSYIWADVWQATSAGSDSFELVQKWVLNNMVRFS